MVRLLNAFDPHVMIDLHTTNGSRHAYHLTYETPNNPAVDPAIVPKDERVDGARSRAAIKKADGWEFHAYGNVSGEPPDCVWRTVEDLPRYTHNYWGVRNRIGILSETYSYLPFRGPGDHQPAVSRRGVGLRTCQRGAAAGPRRCGRQGRARRAAALAPLAAGAVAADRVEILMGEVEEDVSPFSGPGAAQATGRAAGPNRCGRKRRSKPPTPSACPQAYFVPADEKVALERLRAHGITLERLDAADHGPARRVPHRLYRDDAASLREPPGADRQRTGPVPPNAQVPAGAYRVPMTQPRARLAFYLLEPRSNDGLLTWNVFDEAVKRSALSRSFARATEPAGRPPVRGGRPRAWPPHADVESLG